MFNIASSLLLCYVGDSPFLLGLVLLMSSISVFFLPLDAGGCEEIAVGQEFALCFHAHFLLRQYKLILIDKCN